MSKMVRNLNAVLDLSWYAFRLFLPVFKFTQIYLNYSKANLFELQQCNFNAYLRVDQTAILKM